MTLIIGNLPQQTCGIIHYLRGFIQLQAFTLDKTTTAQLFKHVSLFYLLLSAFVIIQAEHKYYQCPVVCWKINNLN